MGALFTITVVILLLALIWRASHEKAIEQLDSVLDSRAGLLWDDSTNTQRTRLLTSTGIVDTCEFAATPWHDLPPLIQDELVSALTPHRPSFFHLR